MSVFDGLLTVIMKSHMHIDHFPLGFAAANTDGGMPQYKYDVYKWPIRNYGVNVVVKQELQVARVQIRNRRTAQRL